MLADYTKVDIEQLKEQVAWACKGCDANLVVTVEKEFRAFHQEGNTLEQWATWMQRVVRTALVGEGDQPLDGPISRERAATFLIHWYFVT